MKSANSTQSIGGDHRVILTDVEDIGAKTSVAFASVNHVGSSVANTEVEEPVGGGGEGHSLASDSSGVDL